MMKLTILRTTLFASLALLTLGSCQRESGDGIDSRLKIENFLSSKDCQGISETSGPYFEVGGRYLGQSSRTPVFVNGGAGQLNLCPRDFGGKVLEKLKAADFVWTQRPSETLETSSLPKRKLELEYGHAWHDDCYSLAIWNSGLCRVWFADGDLWGAESGSRFYQLSDVDLVSILDAANQLALSQSYRSLEEWQNCPDSQKAIQIENLRGKEGFLGKSRDWVAQHFGTPELSDDPYEFYDAGTNDAYRCSLKASFHYSGETVDAFAYADDTVAWYSPRGEYED